MHKKFDKNQTKIKGGCQSGSKVVTHDSKSDLPQGEFTSYVDRHFHLQYLSNFEVMTLVKMHLKMLGSY